MSGREELAALLFELQRARGPVEKARAAARAWRTLRELSPTERRMIAREIGSSGAEELLESLGRGGRGFSPAAVLDALTRVEDDDGTTLDEIVADLRDPERRAGAMGDMVDAAVDLAIPEVESRGQPAPDLEVDGARDDAGPELALPPVPGVGEAAAAVAAPDDDGAASREGATALEQRKIEPPEPAIPPPTPSIPQPRPAAPRAPSVWDEMQRRPVAAPTGADGTSDVLPDRGAVAGERSGSVLRRLRELRGQRSDLASATPADLRRTLEDFPEPWARRRALSLLLAEGIPADAATAVELVAELERATDRRWCLGVLAGRGDLEGAALERALDLLPSPAARRRLARRARVADEGP